MALVSEQLEQAPAVPAETAEPERKRRLWPLLSGVVVAAAIAVTGTIQVLGPEGALIAGGCVAGVGGLGLVLWRLPQLRRHFRRPGGARPGRRWSFRRMSGGGRAGQRGGGLKLPKLGGRASGGRGGGLGGKLGRALKGKGASGGKSGLGSRLGKALSGKGTGSGSRLGKLAGGRGRAGKLGGGLGRMLRGGGKGLAGGPGRGGKAGKLGGLGRALTGRRRAAGTSTGGKGQGGSGKTRPGRRGRVGRGLRAIGRGTRSAFRRSRKAAGGNAGQSRARAIGTTLAAVPLVPLFAGWAAWKKARSWWRRRRNPGQQPAESNPAAQPSPQPVSEPGPPRLPGRPLAPDSTPAPTRRRRQMSNVVDAVTDAIGHNIGSYEPENVDDLGGFLAALPELYEALASSLTRVADRFADELPVHPDVAEHIRELASQAAGQHEYAGEAYGLFRSRHDDDLERLENPRPGEEFMDHSRQ